MLRRGPSPGAHVFALEPGFHVAAGFVGAPLVVTGRVWKGTAFGGARGRTDVPRIVDWYMDGKINIDDLITHVLPFEQINEGFDLMRRGESIRTVLTY